MDAVVKAQKQRKNGASIKCFWSWVQKNPQKSEKKNKEKLRIAQEKITVTDLKGKKSISK